MTHGRCSLYTRLVPSTLHDARAPCPQHATHTGSRTLHRMHPRTRTRTPTAQSHRPTELLSLHTRTAHSNGHTPQCSGSGNMGRLRALNGATACENITSEHIDPFKGVVVSHAAHEPFIHLCEAAPSTLLPLFFTPTCHSKKIIANDWYAHHMQGEGRKSG